MTYERMMGLAHRDKYQPTNTLEFLTKPDLDIITNLVYNKYKVHLVPDISLVKIFVTNTGNSLIFGFGIPVEDNFNKISIFKIHPLPTIFNKKKYIPKSKLNICSVSVPSYPKIFTT